MVYTKLPGGIPRCRVQTDGTTPGCLLEFRSVPVRVEKFFIQIQARLVEHFLKVPTWVVVCTLRAQAALNMEAELLRKGGHGYVSISIADGGFSIANLFCDSSFFFCPPKK